MRRPGSSRDPSILGHHIKGPRVFVRPCYPSLAKKIDEARQRYLQRETMSAGAVIIGISGVGKSVFVAYMIKHLRTLPPPLVRPTIIFQDASMQSIYVLRPGASSAERHMSLHSICWDESMVYIVDRPRSYSHAVPIQAGYTLVLATPEEESSREVRHWEKHCNTTTIKYMPHWDAEELETFRRVVCPTEEERTIDRLLGLRVRPGASAEAAQQMTDRFGGMPRLVIASTPQQREGWESMLRHAICHCSRDIVTAQLENIDQLRHVQMSHGPYVCDRDWLFHILVDEEFNLKRVIFASHSIADEVCARTGVAARALCGPVTRKLADSNSRKRSATDAALSDSEAEASAELNES